MKRIFVPKMEDLEKMEAMGANVESYLAAKVVEIIMVEGMKYSNQVLVNEDPTIAHSVCLLNPEVLRYSGVAIYDNDLCLKLLDQDNEEKTSNLNMIDCFSDSVITNQLVIKKVVEVLYKEIRKNPNLRFTYKDNMLLNNIFAGTFEYYLNNLHLDDNHLYYFIYMLATIEPYYGLLLNKDMSFNKKEKKVFIDALNDYLNRYDIQSYDNYSYHGVVNEQNKNTKKYLQRIREYKKDNIIKQ